MWSQRNGDKAHLSNRQGHKIMRGSRPVSGGSRTEPGGMGIKKQARARRSGLCELVECYAHSEQPERGTSSGVE